MKYDSNIQINRWISIWWHVVSLSSFFTIFNIFLNLRYSGMLTVTNYGTTYKNTVFFYNLQLKLRIFFSNQIFCSSLTKLYWWWCPKIGNKLGNNTTFIYFKFNCLLFHIQIQMRLNANNHHQKKKKKIDKVWFSQSHLNCVFLQVEAERNENKYKSCPMSFFFRAYNQSTI